MSKAKTDYWKVVATENVDSADIYLYGFIGQDDWWTDEPNNDSLTDLAVVKKISELQSKYNRINVRINSPGGSVFHGDPIISALRNSSAEIHTYIDGLAASMAADIWAVGDVRHMNSNSKLMIHSTSTIAIGTALDMMEAAEMLEKFDTVAIATFSSVTNMSEEEVRKQFYDYRDHWITAPEAAEMGLISKVEDYSSSAQLDPNLERMSYSQLIRQFSQAKEEDNRSVIQRLRDKIFNRAQPQAPAPDNSITKTSEQMKIEDFQKSLADGELDTDAVIEAVKGLGYEVTKVEPTPPATTDTVDISAVVGDAVKAALAPLNDEVTQLRAQVKTLGDAPGAAPTGSYSEGDPASGADPSGTVPVDHIKVLADAANKGERIEKH